MKLSVAWIFDHINAHVNTVDVPALVSRINQTTAEIEGFYPITFDLAALSAVELTALTQESATIFSPEWNITAQLPARKDGVVGAWYVIKKQGNSCVWAMASDFGSAKDHWLPAFDVAQADRAGAWKKALPTTDYILELDNKSVTNRPDLWGHRGFAREVAALLNLPFKPLSDFVVEKKVIDCGTITSNTHNLPLILENQAPDACKRIAGMRIEGITAKPSSLSMAQRLCCVDSKPITLMVDATNYVMLDIGQPMHVFDAAYIESKTLAPRFARAQEKLTLLDGARIELSAQDLIITDGTKPLALAGIMGGLESAVSLATTEVIVEAACFDASTIRKAAERHKLRTEASARFEKTLDPNQTIIALERFVYLIAQAGITLHASSDIFVAGNAAHVLTLVMTHDVIERRLGAVIQPDFVIATLTKLGFKVDHTAQNSYTITVPSFRSSKDISIKEDIIEEIGRFIGYANLERVMPTKQHKPHSLDAVMRLRTIKRSMAYGLSAKEIYNYSFFDEEFLQQMQWQPVDNTPAVCNPVSENWRRLVSSLAPHLFKAVANNSADYDSLRFFEWARTWSMAGSAILEKKALAAIIYEKKKTIDFYQAKAELNVLFDALALNVVWCKLQQEQAPWYMAHQTAQLLHSEQVVGTVGKVDPLFLNRLTHGDAWLVELDGDFLLNYKAPLRKYAAASKYPDSIRDISILIPLQHTVDSLVSGIAGIDKRITTTTLIDFFQKPEWKDQKSLTFRLVLQDTTKTLTTAEVDEVIKNVTDMLTRLGATIR